MCLHTGLRTTPEFAAKVVVVCAALHNLATLHEYNTDNLDMQFEEEQPSANQQHSKLRNHFERDM